jgi:hypothetical protein
MLFLRYLSRLAGLPGCFSTGSPADMLSGNLTSHNYPSHPFGITLSPNAVTASRYNSSGLIELTRFPVTTEYKSYYTDAINNHGKPNEMQNYTSASHNATIAMFREIISPITTSLRQRVSNQRLCTALFLPSVFDHTVLKAAETAILGDFMSRSATIYGSTYDAVCEAYDFQDFENPRACEVWDDLPRYCARYAVSDLSLVLEFEDEYLHAFLMGTGRRLVSVPVVARAMCKKCSGNSAWETRLRLL